MRKFFEWLGEEDAFYSRSNFFRYTCRLALVYVAAGVVGACIGTVVVLLGIVHVRH